MLLLHEELTQFFELDEAVWRIENIWKFHRIILRHRIQGMEFCQSPYIHVEEYVCPISVEHYLVQQILDKGSREPMPDICMSTAVG